MEAFALAGHPLTEHVEVIGGRAVDRPALERIEARTEAADGSVLFVLGASPRRAEVAAELEAVAPLVPVGGWLVVFGGSMQWVAAAGLAHARVDGRWNWATDNALVATEQFLGRHDTFEAHDLGGRLGATFAPNGYLRRAR
jgi:cephalosporin hydroxylase